MNTENLDLSPACPVSSAMDVFVAVRTRRARRNPRIDVLGAYLSKADADARLAESRAESTARKRDDDDSDDDEDDDDDGLKKDGS